MSWNHSHQMCSSGSMERITALTLLCQSTIRKTIRHNLHTRFLVTNRMIWCEIRLTCPFLFTGFRRNQRFEHSHVRIEFRVHLLQLCTGFRFCLGQFLNDRTVSCTQLSADFSHGARVHTTVDVDHGMSCFLYDGNTSTSILGGLGLDKHHIRCLMIRRYGRLNTL